MCKSLDNEGMRKGQSTPKPGNGPKEGQGPDPDRGSEADTPDFRIGPGWRNGFRLRRVIERLCTLDAGYCCASGGMPLTGK